MNILHMKYAVEVAKAGSINKASEALFIAQPNLSRSIKELEADLGITVFDRSAKGMFLTPEGEDFIARAKKILEEIEDVENTYRGGAVKRKFSVSVPRASYMSDALANFAKGIGESNVEIFYKETNSSKTIKNILSGDYKLGIIRYAENYDKYFKTMLEEKGLAYFESVESAVGEGLEAKNTVVATGGSMILYEKAMAHLKDIATVVYIDVSLQELKKRLVNIKTRGITFSEGETLEDIFNARTPLYKKYADVIIDANEFSIEETVTKLTEMLNN